MSLQGRRILVGVTGSIAAYKTCDLVFRLRREGARVGVVLTAGAAGLVTPETFRALSGAPVHTRLFGHPGDPMPHIALARGAQLLVVAPATAHFLAQAAAGLAPDLLTTLFLTVTCPVLVAPAMNTAMWRHPAVQRNVVRLREDGVEVIDPVEGDLACRERGQGKMAPVETLLTRIRARF